MTTEEIKLLLQRFYDAETTDAEERSLRAFFHGPAVPAELEADKALFDQLYAPTPEPSQAFVSRLGQDIERWNVLEKTTARRARTLSMRWMTGVAASMLALFALGTYLNHRSETSQAYSNNLTETYDNPNDAAGETARALTKFSDAINRGIDKMNNTETNNRQ